MFPFPWPLVFFLCLLLPSSTQATRHQVLPPLAQMPCKLAFHGVRLPVGLVNCCERHGPQRISVPRVSQSNIQFSKGSYFDVLVLTLDLFSVAFTGQLSLRLYRQGGQRWVANEKWHVDVVQSSFRWVLVWLLFLDYLLPQRPGTVKLDEELDPWPVGLQHWQAWVFHCRGFELMERISIEAPLKWVWPSERMRRRLKSNKPRAFGSIWQESHGIPPLFWWGLVRSGAGKSSRGMVFWSWGDRGRLGIEPLSMIAIIDGFFRYRS